MYIVIFLIGSGGYNKVSLTRQLINNRKLFFTVLKARIPGSGCQYYQVLVRVLFQVTDR